MHSAYFETRFTFPGGRPELPASFAIISAFAPTGQTWNPERNAKADRALQHELVTGGVLPIRVIGSSPDGGHREPSWCAQLRLEEALKVGRRFLQDAIYWVEEGMLWVTGCGVSDQRVEVGPFRDHLDGD